MKINPIMICSGIRKTICPNGFSLEGKALINGKTYLFNAQTANSKISKKSLLKEIKNVLTEHFSGKTKDVTKEVLSSGKY